MVSSRRIVVFDAHMIRRLILNDESQFPSELQAFRVAFQGRRFRILITDGILDEYMSEANKFPPFQVQPTLNNLLGGGRAIRLHEFRLNRFGVEITGLIQEHSAFILDAIAAQASYFVTNYRPWLGLSDQAEKYGLHIVTPDIFVQLER